MPLAFALSASRMFASTAVDEGAKTSPMPMPAAMKAGSIVVYATSADIVNASQVSPAPWKSRPATISTRVPTRGAMNPARGATTIGAIVHGVVCTAASSGEAPCTTWRNWIRMNTAPNIPNEKPKPTTFAMLNPRSRKRRSGSSGAAARASQTRNATTRAAPATRAPTTSNESQPASLPRTMPKTRPSTPSPASSTPGMSSRTRAPRVFGSTTNTSGSTRMPTGTLIQKIASQLQPSTTAPPMSGPAATPRPAMPPQMPIASGRRRSATAPASSERESGMMPAPPSPWRARATMSWVGSVLSAASTDAPVKITIPARNIVRRPMRSPRATAKRIRLANASVYALTNHWSSSTVAPSSAWMTGSAFVMTRLSRVAMNIGMPVAARASPKGTRRATGEAVREDIAAAFRSNRMITWRIGNRLIPCQA